MAGIEVVSRALTSGHDGPWALIVASCGSLGGELQAVEVAQSGVWLRAPGLGLEASAHHGKPPANLARDVYQNNPSRAPSHQLVLLQEPPCSLTCKMSGLADPSESCLVQEGRHETVGRLE